MSFDKYKFAPWKRMGRGPYEYDCWGLVRKVYIDVLGVTLPDFLVDPDELRLVLTTIQSNQPSWCRVDEPNMLALVAMSKNTRISHIGVYIGNGNVLHASREAGMSIVQTVDQLRRTWNIVEFYSYMQ